MTAPTERDRFYYHERAETFNLVLKALQNAQDGNPCPLFEDALNALKNELTLK